MSRLPTFLATSALALLTAAGCASSTPATTSTASGQDAAGTADTQTGADGATADTQADATTTGGPTFHKDVEPILQQKCQGCHSGTGIAPFALMTYADAKLRAESSVAAIEAGRMPPWGAQDTAECTPRFPWQHDLRVTAAEKKTLQDWITAGNPEGNPADAPAAGAAPTLELANIDLTVQPDHPYTANGKDDLMRCFLIDPKLTELKYLNGIQVTPGNPLVVHHVLVFTDPNNDAAGQADANGQYDCFGGVGVSNAKLIEAWAPGGVPLEFPSNVGTPIAAGTRFVMQVHYHPAGASASDPDLTKVHLRFTKAAPEWIGSSVLIGNFNNAAPDGGASGSGLLPGEDDPQGKPTFVIPADKAAHKEEMRFTLPAKLNGGATPKLHIYGAGTHMHYVGRDMKVWVERNQTPVAPCTAAQVGPISQCVAKNCPGASGNDLITCALGSCKAEAAALQGDCGDCIQAGVLSGSGVSEVLAQCQQVPAQVPATGDPASECLVQTPQWDFNWQRIYNYAAPLESLPTFQTGDVLRLRCTYDNTLANAFVKEALGLKGLDKPVPVTLGETTLDEMCLAIVQVVYKL